MKDLPVCKSFAPETPVLLADGTSRPIKDIKVGDEVLTTDPATRTTEPHTVTLLHRNVDHLMTDLQLATDERPAATIHTTQNHLFWSETRHAWVAAGDLEQGELLHTPDGMAERVVARDNFYGAATMDNLTVDAAHTYYVIAGNTPVLVHNEGDGPNPWTISVGKSTAVMRGGPFGANYYQQVPDSNGDVFWWSPDKAGHAGSAWKVYRQTSTGLEWAYDADVQGNFMSNKYKGNTGKVISFKNLKAVNAPGVRGCL